MNLPDLINGFFELGTGLFQFANVYALWKDKEIKGVYWPFTGFVTAWGAWNLYFYPHLNQWLSFVGGLSIFGANGVWLALAIWILYFRKGQNELST